MRWPWSKSSYLEGSIEISSDELRSILNQFNPLRLSFVDTKYLLLDYEKIKDMFFDFHSAFNIIGHPEFPDCDDFAFICWADILRGAIKDGFRLSPAGGLITLTRISGKRHQLNFAVTNQRSLRFYEPQTGKWEEPDGYVFEFEG